jgi:hypothetical protein
VKSGLNVEIENSEMSSVAEIPAITTHHSDVRYRENKFQLRKQSHRHHLFAENFFLDVKIKIWSARYLQNGRSYCKMDCGIAKFGTGSTRKGEKFVSRTTAVIVA